MSLPMRQAGGFPQTLYSDKKLVSFVIPLIMAVLFMSALASPVYASRGFDQLSITLDRALDSPAGPISGQQILSRTSTGNFSVRPLALPPTVSIAALDDSSEPTLFVSDSIFAASGLTFTPRDIARRLDSGELEIEISASELGLEPPSRLIALSRSSEGLLFSVDLITDFGEFVATPQDVLLFDGEAAVLYLEGEPLGISKQTRIQGITSTKQGNLVLALESVSEVQDQTIRRGDLFLYDLTSGEQRLAAPAIKVFGDCSNCNITALSGTFDEDVLFRSSFNAIWN